MLIVFAAPSIVPTVLLMVPAILLIDFPNWRCPVRWIDRVELALQRPDARKVE
jgi:hypothetical protein